MSISLRAEGEGAKQQNHPYKQRTNIDQSPMAANTRIFVALQQRINIDLRT